MDKVVHFEIPADSLDRASDFYKKVFGWGILAVPMEDEVYYIARTVETDERNMPKVAGAINGAITRRNDTIEAPIVVINVGSIDEYVDIIENAGGAVIAPKKQVLDMGYYARIEDTEGNTIGIWEDIKK